MAQSCKKLDEKKRRKYPVEREGEVGTFDPPPPIMRIASVAHVETISPICTTAWAIRVAM